MSRTSWSSRRRGSAYAFFLGSSMLVSVIGLSALAVVRVQLQAAGGGHDDAAARINAQSAIEFGLLHIYASAGWRDALSHDTWQTTLQIGDGSLSWKVVDETDADFTADRNGNVRLYGRGVCGQSVYVYSVLVQPPLEILTSNVLVNGDFETGVVSPWVSEGACTLTHNTAEQRSGTGCLWVQFRDAGSAARQRVTGLTSGAVCQGSVWVRKQVGGSDPFWAGLWVRGDGGWDYFEFGQVVTNSSWAEISGIITPTWSGALQDAAFEVGGVNAGAFFVDDAQLLTAMRATVGPIPGTWRRESQ